MEHDKKQARIDLWIRVVLGLLMVAMLVLLGLLFHEYRQLEQEDVLLSMHHALHIDLLHHTPGEMTDPALIQSWMTFGYVSAVYGVSTSTLQTALNINDPRYPRLAIEEYAEDHKLDQKTFLLQVQDALAAALTQKPS